MWLNRLRVDGINLLYLRPNIPNHASQSPVRTHARSSSGSSGARSGTNVVSEANWANGAELMAIEHLFFSMGQFRMSFMEGVDIGHDLVTSN